LTHTAGIRWANFSTGEDWDRVIEAINTVRPEPRWTAGQKAGYHALTSWYVLGEIIARLTGRDFESALQTLVLEPAGMNRTTCFLSADELQNNPRHSGLYNTKDEPMSEDRSTIGLCSPGSSLRGPVRELGRFYEMLLRQLRTDAPGSDAAIRPQTIEALTARHRVGMFDHTFKRVLDWGLGFIVNSRYLGGEIPYGFGDHASMRAFGHGGRQSSIAFADPEHQLVIALAFNGMPGEKQNDHRTRPILSALYEELGLANPGQPADHPSR
jgi:CubicO group peptidase (beta-lactamase class C family)